MVKMQALMTRLIVTEDNFLSDILNELTPKDRPHKLVQHILKLAEKRKEKDRDKAKKLLTLLWQSVLEAEEVTSVLLTNGPEGYSVRLKCLTAWQLSRLSECLIKYAEHCKYMACNLTREKIEMSPVIESVAGEMLSAAHLMPDTDKASSYFGLFLQTLVLGRSFETDVSIERPAAVLRRSLENLPERGCLSRNGFEPYLDSYLLKLDEYFGRTDEPPNRRALRLVGKALMIAECHEEDSVSTYEIFLRRARGRLTPPIFTGELVEKT